MVNDHPRLFLRLLRLSIKHLFHFKIVLAEHIHISVDINAAHIVGMSEKRNVYKLYKLITVEAKKNIFAPVAIYDANAHKLIFAVNVI